MSLHTPKQITPEYYLFQIVAKMELYRCRCQLRTKSKWDMGYKEQQEAERLKAMLLRIYQCKKPFELMVIDKKPKTRMGCYVVDRQRIRIYSKYRSECPLEEIAIHEYAHHIHHTEQYSNDYRRDARKSVKNNLTI